MDPNFYLIEKMSEAHRQELLREAARERLLAQLPASRERKQACRWEAGRTAAMARRQVETV